MRLLYFSLAASLIFLSAGISAAQTVEPESITSSDITQSALPRAESKHAPKHTEDWTTLSIRNLDFGSASATVTEHDVRPTYTRDLVRVQWRAGDSIELFVFLPRKTVKPPPVLYLYSYPADIDRFFSEAWAERATADGFAAIGFVSALTGQRYHSRPMKEWFISELPEALGASVHDVQMILDYLGTRGDVDMGHIGMFGQGSGATIAILTASVDSRIQALDLLDPWGDWPEWLSESPLVPEEERANFLKPEFLHSVASLDPVAYLHQLRLSNLRIQQIKSDPVTPQRARDTIAAAAPSPEVVTHFEDATAHFEAMRHSGVSGWLKVQLSGAASPASTTEKLAQSPVQQKCSAQP